MHHRWEVFRGDSTNASDLLFTVKKSSIIQLKTEMDVFLAGNTAEQVCDFKIKGSYFDRSCIFYLGNSNTMIAQVSTRTGSVSNHIVEFYKFLVNVCTIWCCRWTGSSLFQMYCSERILLVLPYSPMLTTCSSHLLLWFWMRFTGTEHRDPTDELEALWSQASFKFHGSHVIPSCCCQ